MKKSRTKCKPSQQHKTREDAITALMKFVNRTGTALRRMDVYYCKDCKHHHFGRKMGMYQRDRRLRNA